MADADAGQRQRLITVAVSAGPGAEGEAIAELRHRLTNPAVVVSVGIAIDGKRRATMSRQLVMAALKVIGQSLVVHVREDAVAGAMWPEAHPP